MGTDDRMFGDEELTESAEAEAAEDDNSSDAPEPDEHPVYGKPARRGEGGSFIIVDGVRYRDPKERRETRTR